MKHILLLCYLLGLLASNVKYEGGVRLIRVQYNTDSILALSANIYMYIYIYRRSSVVLGLQDCIS